MEKRKAQTRVRSKAAVKCKENPDYTIFTGNTPFTLLDKLHCVEREERRLRRIYHAKVLKGERIKRNEGRNIEIMNAIVADLRQAARR